MDKRKVEEVHSKLLEINKLIEKLDPAIKSAAFDILTPFYFDELPSPRSKSSEKQKVEAKKPKEKEVDTSDLGEFITQFEHVKPKDNVMLLAAWLYSQYGAYPIQAKEIKELADACGLVIPSRADNTMRQAKDKGKSLFTQQGKGWKPTVSAELFLKNIYGVKKGNKTIPKE